MNPMTNVTIQVQGCVAWTRVLSVAVETSGQVNIFFGDRTRLVHISALEIQGQGRKRHKDKPQGFSFKMWLNDGIIF